MQTLPRPGMSLPLGIAYEGGPVQRRFNALRTRRHDPLQLTGSIVTFLVVAGAVVFTFLQLQPGLLFGPNTDVGGDTAGHVVAVNYFIHHLLNHFQLTGWDPEWFGGFPLYTFYFPLPALLIAALSVVFPYAVAFKLVTALSLLFIPLAAYAFGRLAGYRQPIPALMSVAMLPMIFDFASGANSGVYVSWNIDGGTIASVMAGEFSFTMALAFALLFLGVFAYALRTGRLRWLAAVLFVVTLLCHVVPALFAAGAAVILTIASGRARSWFKVLLPVGVAGGLLSAFWLLPFGAYLRYTSSMGYGRVGNDYQNLIPQNGEQAVEWIALVGVGLAIYRRDRIALALAAMAVCSALGFILLPSGFVYNGRWLPFWFLSCALLAAYSFSELGRVLFGALGARRWHPPITGAVGGLATICIIAAWMGVLPGYATTAAERNPSAGWTQWNYSGYQAKPGWTEFQNLVSMTEGVAKRYGCGLMDYEYSPNLTDWYGSTLVPMSFPLWTNGCIDTTEGLYYESSTTTDFHFLDQAELSLNASNPVVGIPYQNPNLADGIRHLQLMGVKYFLANAPSVEQEADSDPSLLKVGSAPAAADDIDGIAAGASAPAGTTWNLYLITDSARVAPLTYAPVVESGMSKQTWRTFSITWYQNEQYWPVLVAESGPSSWLHKPGNTLVPPSTQKRLPSNTVRGITTTDDSVTFDVSRTGVPVVVKVPYFPNWQASGATGPYPVTPNLMVVVPTSHHVTLHYGTTGIDWTGRVASLAGVAGTVWLISPAFGISPGLAGPGLAGPGLAVPGQGGFNFATGATDGGISDSQDDDEESER